MSGPEKGLGLFEVRFSMAEEERVNPSLLLCLAGCNLDCVFCNADWETVDSGYPQLSRKSWPELERLAQTRGAKSIGITGGEPLLYSGQLAEIIPEIRGPSVVLHTSLSGSWDSISMLLERVDLVVGCLKFGNRSCADRLCPGGGLGAFETPRANALALARTGKPFVIRHLLMPGHVECCWAGVARLVAGNCPQVPVSLLTGFVPPATALGAPELLRCLSSAEVERAGAIAGKLGLVLERNGVRGADTETQTQTETQTERETIDMLIDRSGRICFHQYGDTAQEVLSALTDLKFTQGGS